MRVYSSNRSILSYCSISTLIDIINSNRSREYTRVTGVYSRIDIINSNSRLLYYLLLKASISNDKIDKKIPVTITFIVCTKLG